MNKPVSRLFRILSFLPTFVFLFSSCISFCLMRQTLNSKLDRWSNAFNNYYTNNHIVPSKAPMIRIQSKTKNSTLDLYHTFYYSNSSTVNSSYRHFYSGDSVFSSANGNDYQITLNKQDAFSISAHYSWGYYLEYGLFSTYYKDELLPNRAYLNRRFGASGVCFISDTLADKLAIEFGLNLDVKDEDGRPKAYEELIMNEQFALLKLKISGQETSSTFCINNILYSAYRTGPRVQELYGDFCVMFGDRYVDNELNYCSEFDMKSDIYGNSSFLKRVHQMGYDNRNAVFSIYKYNNALRKYQYDAYLSDSLKKINFDSSDLVYYLFSFILTIAFVTVTIFFRKKVKINGLIISTSFFLYNFALIFVFVDPISNLFITINYVLFLIVLLASYFAKNKRRHLINNYEKVDI